MSDTLKDIEGLSEKKRALLELLMKERKAELQANKTQVIPRRQPAPFYPLSFAQQRLWFLHQLMQESHSYNIHFSEHLKGSLNVEALHHSLNEAVRRHEALRTTFVIVDGQPVQSIAPSLHLDLPIIDLSELPAAIKMVEVRQLARQAANESFDLSTGPLLQTSLLKLAGDEHVLLLTLHHIICDGWSTDLLIGELATLYEAYLRKAKSPLPDLRIQYADFAVWQREWLQGEVLENLLGYWKTLLGNPLPVLELPTDRLRPAIQTFHGGNQAVKLGPALTQSLMEMSRREGVTLFMTMLAAFNVLLSRYSGQTDFIVGTPIANRDRTDTQALIGVFINMLALRTDLSGNPTFAELLRRTREVSLQAYTHQDLPFEKLVEHLQPERDVSRHPIFQVMLVMQSASDETLRLPDLELTPFSVETGTAQFDLTLAILESVEGLLLSFDYNTDLFDGTVSQMIRHFETILGDIVKDTKQHLSDLSQLTGSERQQVLVEWNNTRADFTDASFIRMFESQAEMIPDASALVFEEERLSYGALNKRANQLAHYLCSLGIGPDVPVALHVERSTHFIMGLLGIHKAGGAYVPIDPATPRQRLKLILEDTKAPVVLTLKSLAENIDGISPHTICLDADWHIIAQQYQHNPICEASGENLAYVIYTSGSTGTAKGVAVEQRQLLNYVSSIIARLGFSGETNFATVSTAAADLGNTMIFPALCTGGCLHVISRERASDPELLSNYFLSHGIDYVKIVPSHLATLLATHPDKNLLPRQRLVMGGEACSWNMVETIRELRGDCKVFNHYGPTETTVGVLTYDIGQTPDGQHTPSVPIGRPINNTQTYILDQYGQPVPPRIAGELYIGGTGLARGYLNNSASTAEKFLPDPFSRDSGARLYRTGDLARYLPNGNVEFLGRLDHQVKIRGFRIEPGEIESILRQHPLIQDALVLAREDEPGERRLVAYLVARHIEKPGANEIRNFIKEKVPEYMVPSAFVFLDTLPLTAQGKINRKALPAPEVRGHESAESYTPPRNEVERMIADIWQDVLKIEKVGASDNFFDLGGHSLLLAQVHSRLRNLFDRGISILDLFKYPTISSLALYISPDLSDSVKEEREQKAIETVSATATTRGADIAIIGIAGRFPGAKNVDEFWGNLRDGVESISFFSDEELEASGVSPELIQDPNYVRAGAVLDDIELFDASFFGFNPREAEITDPQHRLFLEYAYTAMESAGYAPDYDGQVVGLYAGVSMATYWMNLFSDPDVAESVTDLQTKVGNDKDHLTTRVSYKLNLKGPSVAVQTTCSSSLVAVHFACRSLLNGECDIALAGGVSIPVPQKEGYVYQPGGIRSPDGHCRAFDAKAQGVVAGSGVALVVLKPLAQALIDGDNIIAVIKGTAINNDGSLKVGYTAPSVQGQADVIARAQAIAGVEPDTISYVEAHGTGTALGDPIEIAALSQVFRARTDKNGYCAIGSVKTNIGHLDTAAGVAGLIKTALALKHKMLPPSLHFEAPNDKLDLDNSPFYVNAALSEWDTQRLPRRAGVSSFGIGGTNAHVIIEEADEQEASSTRPCYLLPISAKTEAALKQATEDLIDYLDKHGDVNFANIAYTLQIGRKAFDYRRAVACTDVESALNAFKTIDPKRVFTSRTEPKKKHIVFMFSGQGTQYANMGREIYLSEPICRNHIDECSALLEPGLGLSLKDILYADESAIEDANHRLRQTQLTQPALFVIEYALAKLWAEWGVHPDSMIGHSLGEYVAACLAGVFSLEDALRLVAARGRLMQSVPEGAMLSVPLPEECLQSMLGTDLSIAAVNGPSLCVVSGPVETIDETEGRFREQGIECRRLRTSHAFHSKDMEPIIESFIQEMKDIKLRAPEIPYISNVTGTWITDSQATDSAYWATHLRRTVRFGDGLSELLKNRESIFLEIGPGHTLASLGRQHADRKREQTLLSCIRRSEDNTPDIEFLMKTLGRLWIEGVPVDWKAFNSGRRNYKVALPTYPFERRRFWIDRKNNGSMIRSVQSDAHKKLRISDWFYSPGWSRSAAIFGEEAEFDAGATWILFADECGLGARIAEQIKQKSQDTVLVMAGDMFAKTASQSYTVNPRSKGDYEKLVSELLEQGKRITNIIHLWSVTGNDSDREYSSYEIQSRGFYSLICLTQSLSRHGLTEPVDLIVVSDDIQEVTGRENLCPDKATVLGPVKVIPQEFLNIRCRSIDIEIEAQRTGREEYLIENLLKEITSKTLDLVVAYRGGHRWTQQFEALKLKQNPHADSLLKQGGTYVITGGLGRIGLHLADYLASTKGAKLALISRTALPEKHEWEEKPNADDEAYTLSSKIRAVANLESLGAGVKVFQADVADEQQMAEVIKQICEIYGKIDGVIHAAGVVGDTVFTQDLEPDKAERQFRAKIDGTKVLEKVLEGREVDFCLLMSSVSSVLGGLGFAAYAASNLFLDAFAQQPARRSRTRWISVNWDGWRFEDISMQQEGLGHNLAELSLTAQEGIEAFERILSVSNLSQIIVSTSNLQARIDRWVKLESARSGHQDKQESLTAAHPRSLQSEYVAPASETEQVIANLLQKLLGVDRVGTRDDFFELGGHSLLAIQVLSQLREIFHVELSMQNLFDGPTVASLAEIIDRTGTEEVKPVVPEIIPVAREAYRMKVPSQKLADISAALKKPR